MRMKLYYSPKSGHSHRVRLFLSLIGAPFDLIEVDLAARQHKSADFLKMNAFGQVPVLEDDTVESLSARILAEEHKIYPQAIAAFVEERLEISGRRVRIRGQQKQ